MDEDKKQKNSVTFFWRSKTKRPKKKKTHTNTNDCLMLVCQGVLLVRAFPMQNDFTKTKPNNNPKLKAFSFHFMQSIFRSPKGNHWYFFIYAFSLFRTTKMVRPEK